jgi:hypothetical protein
MWCMQCNHDLSECICPDLKERLESLRQCPNIHIPSMVVKPLLENEAKRNRPNEKKENN